MKQLFFQLLALCFLFHGCKNEPNATMVNPKCRIETKDFILPASVDVPGKYLISQIVDNAGQKMLVGYNYSRNQMDLWDFGKREVLKTIQFTKEGPESIGEITSFFYHNADTIFLVNLFKLYLIDSDGNIALSERVNTEASMIKGLDFGEYTIYADKHCPLYFSKSENKLYFSMKSTKSQASPEYYQSSICASIDLRTMRAEALPIGYPEYFKKEYYGFLNKPNFLFLEDRIIYNFKTHPDIFVFDKQRGNIGKFTTVPLLCNRADPLPVFGSGDLEAMTKHLSLSPHYMNLYFDKKNNLYFRFHYCPNVEPNLKRNGKYMAGKKYLHIMDAGFNLLLEKEVPDIVIDKGLALTPAGMMCLKREGDDENSIPYTMLSLAFN